MRISAKRHFSDSLEQLAEAGVARKIAPHDELIHQKPDEIFGFSLRSIRDVRAHQYVGLARPPMHQCLKRGKQRDVERDVLASAYGLELRQQLLRQNEDFVCSIR